MNRKSNIPVLIVFALATVVIVGATMTVSLPRDAEWQIKINIITSAVGGLIALMSAALLLFRAVSGESLSGLIPLTLPLLAGILITSFHWAIAAFLVVLGVAVIVREVIGTPAERMNPVGKAD